MTSIEVLVIIFGWSWGLIARFLDRAEHGSPISICKVILLILRQFTINCDVLVHIQTIAVCLVARESRTGLIGTGFLALL